MELKDILSLVIALLGVLGATYAAYAAFTSKKAADRSANAADRSGGAVDKIAAAVCVLLFTIGIPLGLWLDGHPTENFTERQQMEKVVAEAPMSFQECAAWAAKSLGDDATAPEHLELTNSCLQMRRGLPDNKADTGKAESEDTKERELSERDREIDARERQERLKALAKLIVQIKQQTREVVAVLRELLEQGQYCDALLNGTRVLRRVQEYNQKWREIGVEKALIPDDELLGILAVAKAGCQAQSK